MTSQTEMTLRSLLAMDPEVSQPVVEQAIDSLHHRVAPQQELTQVIRYKELMKLLGVTRKSISYYVRKGYLDRVYGCGRQRAIGVSKESYVRFTSRHY